VADFQPGDVVVLKSGSMRMLVERVEGDAAHVLWANEGAIGRETLPMFALNKWEDRGPRERSGEDRSPFRGGDRPDRGGDRGGPPRGGDRGGPPRGGFGDKPRFSGPREGGGKPFSPRPPKVGMDGKPKAKKFYRKDD